MMDLQEVEAIRRDFPSYEAFWEAVGDRCDEPIFDTLRNPGAGQVAALARQLLELDLSRLPAGLPSTYHSDDPIEVMNISLLSNHQAPVLMSMAKLAGAAALWRGSLQARAIGRRSSNALLAARWEALRAEVVASNRLLPTPPGASPSRIRARNYAAADTAALHWMTYNPDAALHPQLQQLERVKGVRASRVALGKVVHKIAELHPELRDWDSPPLGPPFEVLLLEASGSKLVLGGSPFTVDYYLQRNHWARFGGWNEG